MTGIGGTTDSDDVEPVTGDVTGDNGNSDDLGLVAGGVEDAAADVADTDACEEAEGVRSVSKVGTVMS